MNQILKTEHRRVSKKIRRKRLIYKANFIISLVLMLVLLGLYIHSEYAKENDEQKAKEALRSINFSINDYDDSNVKLSDDSEVVLLGGGEDETEIDHNKRTPEEEAAYRKAINETKKKSASGDTYYNIGLVEIPKIKVSYAIINKTTDELLKISPTKFWGPDPNKVGNLCIVGHNYRNNKFFSKVPTLENGDIIKVTDVTGRTIDYAIYDKYVVEPENVSATSQKTDGKKEITIITCTNDSVNRVIVKAREVEGA